VINIWTNLIVVWANYINK